MWSVHSCLPPEVLVQLLRPEAAGRQGEAEGWLPVPPAAACQRQHPVPSSLLGNIASKMPDERLQFCVRLRDFAGCPLPIMQAVLEVALEPRQVCLSEETTLDGIAIALMHQ